MSITVAMTTYNGSNYIIPLLDSIKNQDLQPDEVVIVDDCSIDDTVDRITKYIERNKLSNWKIYKNSSNIGWKKNFRFALSKSNGDTIFLCDQDDIWMPFKIYEMDRTMQNNPEILLLASNYSVLKIDREDQISIRGIERDDATIKKIPFSASSLTVMRPGCTYCIRRSLLDCLQENDNANIPHDAILWGFAAINDGLYLYNRKTINFRRHMQSASTPQTKLDLTRRIEEICYDIEIERFFYHECIVKGSVEKQKIINSQLSFSTKRKKILQEASLIKMIFFQINNFVAYPTLRNALSDYYVIINSLIETITNKLRRK